MLGPSHPDTNVRYRSRDPRFLPLARRDVRARAQPRRRLEPMTAQPCKVALLTLAMALVDSTETTKGNATLADFSMSFPIGMPDASINRLEERVRSHAGGEFVRLPAAAMLRFEIRIPDFLLPELLSLDGRQHIWADHTVSTASTRLIVARDGLVYSFQPFPKRIQSRCCCFNSTAYFHWTYCYNRTDVCARADLTCGSGPAPEPGAAQLPWKVPSHLRESNAGSNADAVRVPVGILGQEDDVHPNETVKPLGGSTPAPLLALAELFDRVCIVCFGADQCNRLLLSWPESHRHLVHLVDGQVNDRERGILGASRFAKNMASHQACAQLLVNSTNVLVLEADYKPAEPELSGFHESPDGWSSLKRFMLGNQRWLLLRIGYHPLSKQFVSTIGKAIGAGNFDQGAHGGAGYKCLPHCVCKLSNLSRSVCELSNRGCPIFSSVAYAMNSRFLQQMNAATSQALHRGRPPPIDFWMSKSVAPMHLVVPGLLTQDAGSKTVQVMDQRLFAEVCTTDAAASTFAEAASRVGGGSASR